MSGRTEMSTTLQDPNLEPTSSTSTTIALIGPNAAHRRVMVKALSGAESCRYPELNGGALRRRHDRR